MKTEPLRFQRKGVRKIQHFNGRSLLADDMGLGKSFQSLLYAAENDKFPAIVVCEAGLKHNWEREARTHLGLRSEVLEGTRPPKKWSTTAKIVIINFDILGPWLPHLKKLKAKLIIVDECQKIKNRKAKRTKNFRMLAKRTKHIVALSGTPLESKPVELYPILNILRPDVFHSFFTYAARYCKPRRRPWGWEYKGATNLKELNELLLKTCMIRRTKKQVLKDLPDKRRSIVIVDIKDREQYEQARNDFMAWLKKNKQKGTSLAKIKRAERLVKAGYLKRLTATLKLDAVMEWIDNFLETTDEKMIFFTYHKKIMKRLIDRYKGRCCWINGSVTGRKRQHAVDEFNFNKHKRLMFGQLEAASKGWSAKKCSNVGVIEFGWLPGLHTQAEDRVHGIGRGIKGQKAHIRYFVAHNTMEEGLVKLLQERQGILEEVLDGRAGEGEDLDIFHQFEKLMLKEGRRRK